MYAFKIERPTSVKQAVALLANEDAKLLAGGHSLIPVMKQRLASPKVLVDLSKIDGLSGIEVTPRTVTIKAMTKHRDVANSKELLEVMPALASVPDSIGDPHVRGAGTIGGSVANNDPNADYPAAVLGLGATIVTNKRQIAADKFFKGLFETSLKDGEIVTAITFTAPAKAAYEKFRNPASRYAIVGVFVAKGKDGVSVAVTGAGDDGVFRSKEIEAALAKNFTAAALDGVKVPAKNLMTDIHASADYRANLIAVMAKRAVTAANV